MSSIARADSKTIVATMIGTLCASMLISRWILVVFQENRLPLQLAQ